VANLPLAQDVNLVPYIANTDSGGHLAVPTEQYTLINGLYLPVSVSNPLPVTNEGGYVVVQGNQQQPLSQQVGNNILKVADESLFTLLEKVHFQLEVLNQITMQATNVAPPNGWSEVK